MTLKEHEKRKKIFRFVAKVTKVTRSRKIKCLRNDFVDWLYYKLFPNV